MPRGILLMGVSGCGKSFAVKTLAKLWEVPLYRLDMNLVFSGLCGRPEAAFHRALRSIESAAPAVLWIDELEDGLSAAGPGHSQSHLFSAFLTWMQEKPPLVFVAATANRIEGLPPEVLRKGRFDEVFFLDLPSAEERAEIFTVHLQLAGIDPEGVRVDYLAADTESWTGAEIEQAVAAARVDAAAAGRAPTTEDLLAAVDRTVPLARTMHEQIRALREWARTRATPASRREGAR
ncbi:MAG: AAA family ATPase [Planctomycetota bacterium]|nr:MAG: AAA family ATPase [Planctomycetota bacterium]